MSSIAATHSESREFDLLSIIEDLVLYALGLVVYACLLGGVLNLTWNELAAVFSFTEPVGGFWTCVLVVLGAYGAFMVYDSARAHLTADVAGNFGGTVYAAGKIGVLLVLAWAVTNFLA